MNVGKLQRALAAVREMFEAAGTQAPAKDLARLEELTIGREHQELGPFLDELDADLKPLSIESVVQQHIGRLKAAGTDEVKFGAAYEGLCKDRLVKKGEADQVAFGYIGGRAKWPNRAAALAAIEKEFVALRYNASKMKEVERSRPW